MNCCLIFFAFCCLPLNPSQVRLTGSHTQLEGRVEILPTNADVLGEWGLICGDDWTTREAMVVCRQLGLGHASSAIRVRYQNFKSMCIKSEIPAVTTDLSTLFNMPGFNNQTLELLLLIFFF